MIAMILSLIITGLGLIYDGLTKRGLIFFAVAIILSLLTAFVSQYFQYYH